MKRVATAVVLIPLVLLAVYKSPLWLFAALLAVVALVSADEYLGLIEKFQFHPQRLTTYFFIVVLFGGVILSALVSQWYRMYMAEVAAGLPLASHPGVSFAIAMSSVLRGMVLLSPLVFLGIALKESDLRTALPSAACSNFTIIYVALPLFVLVQVRSYPGGAFLVFYTLVVVWAGDTFAYYAGRAFGRHKLAPTMSPGKTWEGAVASFIGAIIVGVLLFQFDRAVVHFFVRIRFAELGDAARAGIPKVPHPLWVYAVLSAGVNVAAQVGDLAESMIKRGAGVKDSGALLPGHGGLLDRIDALLFAAPIVWYYALIVASVPS